jgi:hypothetical protein
MSRGPRAPGACCCVAELREDPPAAGCRGSPAPTSQPAPTTPDAPEPEHPNHAAQCAPSTTVETSLHLLPRPLPPAAGPRLLEGRQRLHRAPQRLWPQRSWLRGDPPRPQAGRLLALGCCAP